MSYKIIKRGKSRANLILSSFYLSVAIGLFFNFIFVQIFVEWIVLILYYFTLFFLFMGTAMLSLFAYNMYKTEEFASKKGQILFVLISVLLLFGMVFIPDGVRINEQTDWTPVYTVPFFLYMITVLIITSVGPTLYYAFKIAKLITQKDLKRKWNRFVIGIIGLFTFAAGTLFNHMFNQPDFRLIWNFSALFIIIMSAYLIYFGLSQGQ